MSTTADAASVLEYIDTAIGLATFLMSDRLAATEENMETYFQLEKSERPPEFGLAEAQPFVALLVIEPDLLFDITTIIHKAKDANKLCMEKAALESESENCDSEVANSICDVLNHIKNRNEGSLPTGILSNLWKLFSCKNSINVMNHPQSR